RYAGLPYSGISGDIEATALSTNLEAAEEIARQLRLRDLGGLIVIDFIDMGPQRNQREVENRLREAVRQDRARVQIGKITRFGLLEMSRQRLRPSLGESSYMTCPRCSGIGNIRSVESLALAILRIIGEEARKERTAKVIAQLPVEVATYLLNEKRNWVQSLESRSETQVILVANPTLETPHYQVRRVRDDQVELPENVGTSYALADTDEEPELPQTMQERKVAEPAAIATVTPRAPAPKRKKKKGPGLFTRLAGLFSSSTDTRKKKKRRMQKRTKKKPDARGRTQRGRRRSDSRKPAAAQKKPRARQQSKKQTKKTAVKDAQRKGKATQDDNRKGARDEPKSDSRKTGTNRRSRGGRRRRRPTDDVAATPQAGSEQPASDRAIVTESAAPPVDDPIVVSMISETPVTQPPVESPSAEDRPPDYEDTQPELPVLRLDVDDPTPAVERKAEAPATRMDEPAGESAAEPQTKDEKAEGRLLPWEPQAPAAEAAEPETAEKD
ncbi:MAG: ribonuclease E/G, partial [Woeseia sp.]